MADGYIPDRCYHRRDGVFVMPDNAGAVVESGGSFTVNPGGSVVFPNPYGGQDYYVDGNISGAAAGSAARTAYDLTVDGLSWANAFATLSAAITASNTSIGLTANRWWARRNRIFACGDQELVEDLTILAEKCDIIGVGFDLLPGPRVNGNHNFAALATGKAYGTRFFNMNFQATAATELFDFPIDSMGVGFYGCDMQPATGNSTHAVRLVSSCKHFRFINNRIRYTSAGGIFAEGIKVEGTDQDDIVIANNHIRATEGIHIVAGTGGYDGLIKGNFIYATALTINDASDLFHVVNNRLVTDATVNVAVGALGITCNALLASGNKLGGVGAGATNADYPFVDPLTS